jgi:hypothetical protein
MSDVTRSQQDEPFELATLQADDLLLNALGQGKTAGADAAVAGAASAASDDEVGALLAAWRMDLATDVPQTSLAAVEDATAVETAPASLGSERSKRSGCKSLRVRIAVAAAVVGVLAGGTAVAAANATPGSPLWSISQMINPERAHRVAAEDALAKARQAIADKQPDRAAKLLDNAAKLIEQVRDPQLAARLRAELAELEQLLLSVTTPSVPLPGTSPGAQPSPSSTGAAHPSPASTSTHGSGSGLPGHLPTSLPGQTQLPIPPLKSLLPTTLPSLPLPGLGG